MAAAASVAAAALAAVVATDVEVAAAVAAVVVAAVSAAGSAAADVAYLWVACFGQAPAAPLYHLLSHHPCRGPGHTRFFDPVKNHFYLHLSACCADLSLFLHSCHVVHHVPWSPHGIPKHAHLNSH